MLESIVCSIVCQLSKPYAPLRDALTVRIIPDHMDRLWTS